MHDLLTAMWWLPLVCQVSAEPVADRWWVDVEPSHILVSVVIAHAAWITPAR
jgi:hypothetical protein